MQPLRAYLLIFSDSGFDSSVHRDLQSLRESWKPFVGRDDVTGIIHIGFGRPETEAFAQYTNDFRGRMLLTASAKWALTTVCTSTSISIGEAESIPLFVAMNGWGYEASLDELGLNDVEEEIPVSGVSTDDELKTEKEQASCIDTIFLQSVDCLNLPVRAANCLRNGDIFTIGDLVQCTEDDLSKLPNFGKKSLQDINQALASINLPPIKSGFPSLDQEVLTQRASSMPPKWGGSRNIHASTTFFKDIPSWLQSVPLGSLGFQTRTFNALIAKGFNSVGDIASFSSEMLLGIPSFGRTSLIDLDRRLKVAIERGPAYVGSEDEINSPTKINSVNGLDSEFKNFESLASVIVAAVASLPTNQEKVVSARMGINSEPMTLQEIGREMDVSRERIRQHEANGMSKIGCDSVWKNVLGTKLAKLLDERDDPLPFNGLSILDNWFNGIEMLQEPFGYLLDHKNILDSEFSLLKANGQLFVSRLDQDEWNKTLKQAMNVLEANVNQKWTMSEARRQVGFLLGKIGRELRSELWVAAKQFAHFSSQSSESEPILVGYGKTAEALVEAVLSESDRALHYSEIQRIILDRFSKNLDIRRVANAASQVGFLYGRGCYGLLKHCSLNYQERLLISSEIVEFIYEGSSDRQWSSAELVEELNERRLGFDGRLNLYTLYVALKDESVISYLGRNVWAQSNEASIGTSDRISIRQAVKSLLLQAGRPLTNSEIKESLLKSRGISPYFQILPDESIISLGDGKWGLFERDIILNKYEQELLVNSLIDVLKKRNSGIHISEIFSCLDNIFEPLSRIKDLRLVFDIAKRSGLMNTSYGDYLFLSEWGEPRRLSTSQAIVEALYRSGSAGLNTSEVIKSASEILGRPVQRDSIYSVLYDSGYRIDEISKKWIIPDSQDAEEDAILTFQG